MDEEGVKVYSNKDIESLVAQLVQKKVQEELPNALDALLPSTIQTALPQAMEGLLSQMLEEELPRLRRRIINLEGYVDIKELESLEHKCQQEIKQLEAKNKDSKERREASYLKDRNTWSMEKQRLQMEREHYAKQAESFGTELEECKTELHELKIVYEEGEEELLQLRRENQEQKERLAILETGAEVEYYYKDTYRWLDGAYELYIELGTQLKQKLASLVGKPSEPMTFLWQFSQRSITEKLYDFVTYELNNGRITEEEERALVGLFEFNYAAVNSTMDVNFTRLRAAVGQFYEGTTMNKYSRSKEEGRVSRVLLQGFANSVTGRIIKKSLVELSG